MNNQNPNQFPNQNPYQAQAPAAGPNGLPRPITAADIPFALKARYFGSGLVVGVFISPLVRKATGLVQPKIDSLMDSLTGKAEGLVEKSSDLMAKAKDMLRKIEKEDDEHDHAGHNHGPVKGKAKEANA